MVEQFGQRQKWKALKVTLDDSVKPASGPARGDDVTRAENKLAEILAQHDPPVLEMSKLVNALAQADPALKKRAFGKRARDFFASSGAFEMEGSGDKVVIRLADSAEDKLREILTAHGGTMRLSDLVNRFAQADPALRKRAFGSQRAVEFFTASDVFAVEGSGDSILVKLDPHSIVATALGDLVTERGGSMSTTDVGLLYERVADAKAVVKSGGGLKAFANSCVDLRYVPATSDSGDLIQCTRPVAPKTEPEPEPEPDSLAD